MTINLLAEEVEKLRSRWTAVDTKTINRGMLRTGCAVSPFLEYLGLTDFRGFPLREHLKIETVAMAGRKPIPQSDVPPMTQMDFSYADLFGGAFADIVAENCCFDGVDNGSNWRRTFRRCSFAKAKLSRNHFRGVFEDCNFLKAQLNLSSASTNTLFLRCNFTKANFRSANWVQVRFENCIFDGAKFDRASVSGSRFIGSAPSEEQLSDTLVAKVVFEDVPGR